MQRDFWIRNGTLVNGQETFRGDVHVVGDRIEELLRLDSQATAIPPGAGDLDASGLLVLPGAIDAHVHLQLPVMDTRSCDDVRTGTRAAACGGITTVIDFAQQERGGSLAQAVLARRAEFEAVGACIDWGLHLAVTDAREEALSEFATLPSLGISSLKLYMVYAGMMVGEPEIRKCLLKAKEAGLLTAIHAEDPAMLARNLQDLSDLGRGDPYAHYLSRPEACEAEADRMLLRLARETGAPLYIVHLGSREGVEAVRAARRQGIEAYAETCPHYLQFTREVYSRLDGCLWVCSPPMKGPDSRAALLEAVADGTVDVAATDHCPFQRREKERGRNDFRRIPNGLGGTQILYPYLLDLAARGLISYPRAVSLCAAAPARLFGMDKRKGTIAEGHDADLVLFDPKRNSLLGRSTSHSAQDHSVWEGIHVTGRLVRTISRGMTVMLDGRFVGTAGRGAFVPGECRKREA